MLFTGGIPKTKQRRKVDRSLARCSMQIQTERNRIGNVHFRQIRKC